MGSINDQFSISPFSNVGKRTDVFAPGENIYSTYCVDKNTLVSKPYEYLNGTSMASPHVAGVAAMVWSANNDLTGAQVKEIVCKDSNKNTRCTSCKMVDANLSVQDSFRTKGSKPSTNPDNVVAMGFVLNEDTNAAIANKTIEFHSSVSSSVYTATTDKDGHYEISLPKEEYHIVAEIDNYKPFSRTVNINSDGVNYLDKILLKRIWTYEITVTDEKDNLLSGVNVVLYDSKGNKCVDINTKNGKCSFKVENSPNTTYSMWLTKEGYVWLNLQSFEINSNDNLTFKLKEDNKAKDKMYAAYLKEVKALINTYGGGKIVDDTSGNSSYKMTGLCYAKLIDFDNDGNEELLCVYGPTKDGNGYEKPYYMKVFGYDGNKVNSLFESGAFFFNYTDWSHRIAYCEDNGQTLLLTRKNPQTFEIYAWSELSGNEFKVVKSISDFNESDPGNIKYTVDNKEVGKAEFDKQLTEWKNKQTYIIFNSNSKEILESNINETNNTLKTLGFVEDEWRTLYKNMLNNELKNLSNASTYFNLYDVNNDGVPELFVKRQDGWSNYEDHYTVINDEVVEIAHGEYNGSSLINPKSEWIMHQCYSNGKFYQFYKFDNGKVIKSEIFRPESGSNGYSINGISVSENEFNTKLAKYDYGPYASIDTENSPWVGVFNSDYRAINPNITSMSGSFGISDFEKMIDAWLPNA